MSKASAISPSQAMYPKGQEQAAPSHLPKSHLILATKVFFSLALLTLVITCIIVSYFQLLKYVTGQVTVAYSIEKYDELDFPAISICPGFKRDKVAELEWPARYTDLSLYNTNRTYSETYPKSVDEMESFWDDITYNLTDLVDIIGTQMVTNGSLPMVNYMPQELLNKKVGCHELRRYDTTSGKCYTLYTYCKAKPHQYVNMAIKFNTISRDSLHVALHHPKAYLGTNAHFWPGPVSVEKLQKDSNLDLILTKRTKKREGGNSIEDDYYDCVLEKVFGTVSASKDKLCIYPSFQSVLGNESSNVPMCQTEQDFFNANFGVINILFLLTKSGCAKPKEETSYEISRRENLEQVNLRSLSYVFIGYGTMDVTVEAEYELQDFYAIVATLGGSIGIFLGFSLLDLVKIVVTMIEKLLPHKM